jgi:hypothetical protein
VEGEDRQELRDLDAVHDRVPVVVPEDVLGCASGGLRESLHRGQFHGLVLGHVARGPVADDHLQRAGDGAGGHRDAEGGLLVPAATAAEHRPGVGAGEQEPAHDVGGEVHVHVLAPEHRVVEQRLPRVNVGRPPVDQGETARVVHPGVDRDDEERPGDAGDRDRDAAGEVPPGLDPVPAVGVDAYEDGFDEEREAFQREPEPEDVAEVLDPHRPQQPEFEGQDGAGHDPDRE